MRRLSISFAIAALSLCSLSAQDLDKILNDHFKASAQEALSKINTFTATGINAVPAMGIEAGFTLYRSRPHNLRIEADFVGSKIIQTYDGTAGWLYAPAMGIIQPQQLGENEIKVIMMQAELDSPLWNYKEKRNKVELLGETDDGSAYMFKVISAAGDETTVWIDKKSSLISKISTRQVVNGMEADVETEMKDYKTVKGIPVAHYMASKVGGQAMNTITIKTVEFDKTIDPSLFRKPSAQ